MSEISERQARLWCMILAGLAGVAAGVARLATGQLSVAFTGVITGLLLGLLAFLYRRGWEPARLIALLLFTLAVIGTIQVDNLLVGVVIASTFALLLAGPWWVLGIGAFTALGLVVAGALRDATLSNLQLAELPVMAMLIGIMAITRFVLEAERRRSQILAQDAQAAQARSEAQSRELALQAASLSEQNEQQRQLLDLVATLEVPAVAIGKGILLAPLVGHLDSRRASSLTAKLLAAVAEQRSNLIILDLSGVPAVDSAVAMSLVRTIEALRLLGCEVAITGVTAPIAATMAQLGIGFSDVKTWRSPHEVLEACLM